MKCTSCNKEFTEGVSFDCPDCGKHKISRCLKCKRLNVKYKCECGFIGP